MSKELFIKDIANHFTNTVTTSFYLRDIQQKQTSENKKNYLEVILQDSTGLLFGTVWEEYMKEEYLLFKEKIIQVKGLVIQGTNNNYQLVISKMQELPDYELSDYVNGISEEETENYRTLLHKYIASIKSQGYKSLLENVFSQESDFFKVPATLKRHHNYNGGLLVYTLSVTCMAKYITYSLAKYNRNPSYHLPYNDDLIVTGGLLHAIGTINMLKPFPEMTRIPESIPLSLHELTTQFIQKAVLIYEPPLSVEEQSLLFHMVGCAYESEQRKPMLRESLILRDAVKLQKDVTRLEHFLASNQEENGAYFDTALNNYIYILHNET